MTSTDALLRYLQAHAAGTTILPIAEPLVVELLRAAGFAIAELEHPEQADVVVVSWDRTFDYAKLVGAFRAVRAGARIVATNPDPFCPTPDGDLPDCAAMLAAVEASTGAARRGDRRQAVTAHGRDAARPDRAAALGYGPGR